jgi:hypothetical protein
VGLSVASIGRRTIGAAIAAFSLAAALAAHAQAPSFVSAQTGTAVAAGAIERAVLQGGVYASLPAGATVDVIDIHVAASAPSVVYLSASSQFIFAACLAGAIDGGAGKAEPGEVIVWNYDGGTPKVAGFDVERFMGSAPIAANPAVQESLAAALERQKRRLFWGLWQPAKINLQAPQQTQLEAAMRQHLSPPAVAELRRAAAEDPDSLPQRVAERFVTALAQRQDDVVAALLHPDLFRRPGQAAGDWIAVRAAYAKSLAVGPLPQELQGAKVSREQDWAHWRVGAGLASYELSLAALDGMPYVVALEPAKPALASSDPRTSDHSN